MEKREELYAGKAKTVYATDDPDRLVLQFRDDASAFDGTKRAALARKGEVNNRFNAHLMRHLAAAGVPNHFEGLNGADESVVKRLEMLPVECVVRNRAAGSLCRRLGVAPGRELEPPIFEFFLKDDEMGDPMINESHIVTFGWARAEEIEPMQAISRQVNDVLTGLFADAGITLVDYKLEFGRFHGELLLGDEFSPDGCRLWDAKSGESLDKDRFRQDLGGVIEAYEEVARRLAIPLGEEAR
ncbi:phosphoribosylaminoimidazolesuccinocarboxamide synthase [Thiohalospira sp.]|uniref:phosphoribosylaminoimidazolesuccinocarboxamide synthase n=1 Tax=Thiohalospira sp. TaxID=3080549 RepID=UPI003981087C